MKNKEIKKLKHEIELLKDVNKDLSGVIEILQEDKKALNAIIAFQNKK